MGSFVSSRRLGMRKKPTTRQTGAFIACLYIPTTTTTTHHLHHCYGHSALTLQGRQQLDFPVLSSFFLFLETNFKRTLDLSRPELFHLVLKATWWPPLLAGTHQQIVVLLLEGDGKQTLVVGNGHPQWCSANRENDRGARTCPTVVIC